MLEFKLTPKHAGLALWGDYASLSRTRELVYRLVDESPSIENEEGFVLGLSYDLRKAAEGQRSKGKRSLGGPGDKCTIYGVEILWPVILIQVAILRHAMAFVPTSRLEQAIMFELEHVVEAALRKAIPAQADEILETTRHVSAGSYKDLEENIDGRCLYFIKLAPRDRLAALPEVMRSFDRLYGLFEQAERKRARAAIPLAALRDEEDWPHFDW